MPFAVVLILLVVGSILFHILSPWTFTELASNWAMVDLTVDITLYITGIVFVFGEPLHGVLRHQVSSSRKMLAFQVRTRKQDDSSRG